MSWTAPRTWVTGEVVTAALMNTHVRDNMLETAPAKAAAAGDTFYATAANAIAALTKGAARYGLIMNAADTAPEWAHSMQSLMTGEADMIYASAANTPARLAKGTALYALIMNAGATAQQWAHSIQSLLTAQADILYASAANTPARLAKSTGLYLLGMNSGGTAPEWVSGPKAVDEQAYGTTTNVGDAYSITLTPAPAAYYNGMRVVTKINADNTGAMTLNVNAKGATACKMPNGEDIPAGKVKANSVYAWVYNGTSFFLQGSDSAGDATAAQVLAGVYFSTLALWNEVGTMPNNAGDVAAVSAHMGAGTTIHLIPATGYTDGADDASTVDLTTVDADLIAANIKTGITLFGVAGTCEFFVAVAGTTSLGYSTGASTLATTYTELAGPSFTANYSGVYRIYMTGQISVGGAGTAYFKLYKNDVAVGTERSTVQVDPNSDTWSEDITLAKGDVVTVYAKHSTGTDAAVLVNMQITLDISAIGTLT